MSCVFCESKVGKRTTLQVAHGQSLGRYLTPILKPLSTGISSLIQPSFVFLHPSLVLFFCFGWRRSLQFTPEASVTDKNTTRTTRETELLMVWHIVQKYDLAPLRPDDGNSSFYSSGTIPKFEMTIIEVERKKRCGCKK